MQHDAAPLDTGVFGSSAPPPRVSCRFGALFTIGTTTRLSFSSSCPHMVDHRVSSRSKDTTSTGIVYSTSTAPPPSTPPARGGKSVGVGRAVRGGRETRKPKARRDATFEQAQQTAAQAGGLGLSFHTKPRRVPRAEEITFSARGHLLKRRDIVFPAEVEPAPLRHNVLAKTAASGEKRSSGSSHGCFSSNVGPLLPIFLHSSCASRAAHASPFGRAHTAPLSQSAMALRNVELRFSFSPSA